jgi:hypothetical protein
LCFPFCLPPAFFFLSPFAFAPVFFLSFGSTLIAVCLAGAGGFPLYFANGNRSLCQRSRHLLGEQFSTFF